jgi:two-component system cell cycle sensor histidine kinase/response regulator CckA
MTEASRTGPEVKDAMRRSEEQFRSIFDGLGDGVAISQPGGKFLEVNRVLCERLGYTREQLLSMPVSAINSPESAATIPGHVDEIMRGGGVRAIDATHVRRDGTEMPIEAVSRLIEFRGKPAILTVYRDIAERKRAEEALAASEARLRTAMDTMLDGVAITSAVRDDAGRIVDFRRDYANPAMGVISGVPANEQVGHTLLELFPAHVANGLFDAYVRVVETGVSFDSAAFRYSDHDGPGGPADQFLEQRVARMADGYVISERDVTEIERVRRERERLAAIVEESPDGILVTDADLRIVYVNSAFAGDLGVQASDVLGRGALEIVGGVVDATKVTAIVEVVRSGKTWLGEADWRRPDGTVGRVDLRITPRLAADGTIEGHVVVARDVTERKRIQTALESSELKYSAAFHTSPDSVNLNRLSDGLYLDISDGFTATTGFTQDDVEGKTSAEIAIWADLETRDQLVAGLRADGVVHNLEMRFRRKDGSLGTGLMSARVIDVDGQPCILSITRDVTDRREAEKRFRTLIDRAGDLIFMVDPSTGQCIEANKAACDRLGYSREEMLALSLLDLAPPEDAGGVSGRLESVIERGELHSETTLLRRDGVAVPVDIGLTIVEIEGRPIMLGIARDISERKQAEAERAALEEQLRQAQKMEGIGRLAGGIAHDFNNLLTAIRGNASLALSELPPGQGPRDDLEQIELAADRAAGLTRQLLAFARRTVLQPEIIDLGAIVRRLEPMLGRIIGEDVVLTTVIPDGARCVLADPGQMEQVIVNLTVNARDAMPDGGKLTITVSEVDGAVFEPAQARHSGPMTTLAVADTGVGMDADTLEHIFEPFFTTKGPGKGTGLGLSTVYGIVHQSGGTITAQSEPDHGSTFTVYLPTVEGLGSAPAPEPPNATATGGARSGTILVVEDDGGVRRFASRVLEGAGYRVLAASGGVEALAVSNREALSLLLTDVVMPGMSGREVAGRIALAQPGIRVLYMSGHTDKGIVVQGVLVAGVHYLAKPFTSVELIAAVDEALAEPSGE